MPLLPAGLDCVKLLQGTAALSTLGVNAPKIFSMLFDAPDNSASEFRKSVLDDLSRIANEIETLTYYDTWKTAYNAVTNCGALVETDILQTLATLTFRGDPQEFLHDVHATRDPRRWSVRMMSNNKTATFLEWVEGKVGDQGNVLDRIYKELEGNSGGMKPDPNLLRNALMVSDGLDYDSIFTLYLKMISLLRASGSKADLLVRTDYDLMFKFVLMVRGIVVDLVTSYTRIHAIYGFLDEKAASDFNDLERVLADYGPDGAVWRKCDAVLDSLSSGFTDGVDVWSGTRLGWAMCPRVDSGDIYFTDAAVSAPDGQFLSALQLRLASDVKDASEYVDTNIPGMGSMRDYKKNVDAVLLNAHAATLGAGFELVPYVEDGDKPKTVVATVAGREFSKHWVNVNTVIAPTPLDSNHVPVATAVRFVEMANRVGIELQYRMLRIEPNGAGVLVGDPQWCGQAATPDATLRLDDGDCGSVSETLIGGVRGLFDAPGGLLANVMTHRPSQASGTTSSGPLAIFAQTTPMMHKADYAVPETAAKGRIARLAQCWSDIDELHSLSRLLVAAGACAQNDADKLSPDDAKAKAVAFLNAAMQQTIKMSDAIGGLRPGDSNWEPGDGESIFNSMSEADLADALRRFLAVRDTVGLSDGTLKSMNYKNVSAQFDAKFGEALKKSALAGGKSDPLPADVFKTVEEKARLIYVANA